jgi:2-iminobutanoate/2-iminopropanoate deaminase
MALRMPVSTDNAPAAIGPYSQAIRTGSLLFCSGQVPLDPSSGELVKEDIEGQARRCLENLSAVCEAAGASLSQAVRCTVYLTDIGDFTRVNEAYAGFFGEEDPPARVAVGVAALPKGADVEIDAIVAL